MSLGPMEHEDTREAITLTAGTSVTINSQDAWKMGNLVYIIVEVTTSAVLSSSADMLKGAPAPSSSRKGLLSRVDEGHEMMPRPFGSVTSGGNIRQTLTSSLPSGGRYAFQFCYPIN